MLQLSHHTLLRSSLLRSPAAPPTKTYTTTSIMQTKCNLSHRRAQLAEEKRLAAGGHDGLQQVMMINGNRLGLLQDIVPKLRINEPSTFSMPIVLRPFKLLASLRYLILASSCKPRMNVDTQQSWITA